MKTKCVRNHPERVIYDAKYVFQLGPRPTNFSALRARHWDDMTVRNLEMARSLSFYAGSYPSESGASKELYRLLCGRLEQLSGISIADMQADYWDRNKQS
jgi:hypothetical protein